MLGMAGAAVAVLLAMYFMFSGGASGDGAATGGAAKKKKKGSKKKAPAAASDGAASNGGGKKPASKKKKAKGGGNGPAASGGKTKKGNKGTPEEREARRTAETAKMLAKAQQKLKEGKQDQGEDDGFSVAVNKSTSKMAKKNRNPKPRQAAGGEAKEVDTGYGSMAFTPVGFSAPVARASKPSCGDCGNCGICCGGPGAGQEQQKQDQPSFTGEVTVDGRKLGAIIGPGGETLNRIQDETCTRINIPQRDDRARGEAKPAKIKIEGSTKEGVAAAKKVRFL